MTPARAQLAAKMANPPYMQRPEDRRPASARRRPDGATASSSRSFPLPKASPDNKFQRGKTVPIPAGNGSFGSRFT